MRRLIAAILLLGAMMAPMQVVSVGVPTVSADERLADPLPSIKVDGCVIEFKTGDLPIVKFEIFSITGQLIKAVTVKSPASLRVELPKGFYIVKCEQWTRRVMLK